MMTWRDAWRELSRRPGRTLLSLLSVVIAVASIVAVAAATAATHQAYQQVFRALAGDAALEVVSVGGGKFREEVATELANLPGVRAVLPVVDRATTLYPQRIRIMAEGIDPDEPELIAGFTVTAGDWPKKANDVMLDSQLAANLGIKPGDSIRIQTSLSLRPRGHGIRAGEAQGSWPVAARRNGAGAGQAATALVRVGWRSRLVPFVSEGRSAAGIGDWRGHQSASARAFGKGAGRAVGTGRGIDKAHTGQPELDQCAVVYDSCVHRAEYLSDECRRAAQANLDLAGDRGDAATNHDDGHQRGVAAGYVWNAAGHSGGHLWRTSAGADDGSDSTDRFAPGSHVTVAVGCGSDFWPVVVPDRRLVPGARPAGSRRWKVFGRRWRRGRGERIGGRQEWA